MQNNEIAECECGYLQGSVEFSTGGHRHPQNAKIKKKSCRDHIDSEYKFVSFQTVYGMTLWSSPILPKSGNHELSSGPRAFALAGLFLIAYKWLRGCVLPLVCQSVGPLVHPSVTLLWKYCFRRYLSVTAPALLYATDGCVSGIVSAIEESRHITRR